MNYYHAVAFVAGADCTFLWYLCPLPAFHWTATLWSIAWTFQLSGRCCTAQRTDGECQKLGLLLWTYCLLPYLDCITPLRDVVSIWNISVSNVSRRILVTSHSWGLVLSQSEVLSSREQLTVLHKVSAASNHTIIFYVFIYDLFWFLLFPCSVSYVFKIECNL